MSAKVFIGSIINPGKSKKTIDVIDGFLVVSHDKIVAIGSIAEWGKVRDKYVDCLLIKLSKSQFLMPGLIDTHIHAPQYPNAGLGYDVPLLEWLDKYTYKLESKYSDNEFSSRVYDAVVRKTLSLGTTTACYFASMYKDSSLILARSAIENGQRAFIGKVNMTRLAPENYIETPEASIRDTRDFVGGVLRMKSSLVQPIITPRFALSVDMELMKKLAELAEEYDLNIQSHISENKDEVALVAKMYPEEKNYASVYGSAGLLTSKTVLAHGIYLFEEEMQLLAAKGTSISHCPNSNTQLKSGICNLRMLEQNGVNVALGTDVAGGSSPSIMDAMRCALQSSFDSSLFSPEKQEGINACEAFYMATLGGAKALAIDKQVGTLEIGKEFDALVIDMNAEESSADLLDDYSALELFQKFIYLGDDRNVRRVYVAGRRLK